MPKATREVHTPKILFMAESGIGKTGALSSLVHAGYTLVIHDFDAGAAIISEFLTDEELNRVIIRPHMDVMKADGNIFLPAGIPEAWSNFCQDMGGFAEEVPDTYEGEMLDEYEVPGITNLPEDYICVIDSLTFASIAAMRYRLRLNIGSTGDESRWQHPYPADYGEAQDLIKGMLGMLYSSSVKCPVIVNTHVRYIGGGGTQTITDKKTGSITFKEMDSEAQGQAQPTAIGRALGHEIPRYFNTVISGELEGSGISSERVIVTRDLPRFPLKNERPISMDQRFPLGEGLRELFKALRGWEPIDRKEA